MRTLVIGDIHGAYKCLIDVLEKANYDPANDRVIFLGDYVDGLPETPQVVEHIMGMQNAVCIRGNHDQWAMEWFEKCSSARSFKLHPEHVHYIQGGKSTYDAYMDMEDKEYCMGRHYAFLRGTLGHFIDEKGRAFVHGGFDHSGLEGCPLMTKMWDRELMETAYRLHNRMGAKVPEYFGLYPEIYVGHTAAKFFTGKEEPANWLNLWAMDTNCGWGGPLVAMDVDTKEVFYSRPAREHYPEYKGR